MKNDLRIFLLIFIIVLVMVSCQLDISKYIPPNIKDIIPINGSVDISTEEALSFILKTYTGKSIEIHLYISETPDFLNKKPILLSHTSYIPDNGWVAGNKYYWKLMVFDGVKTFISDTYNFTVKKDVSYKINLLDPPDDEIDVVISRTLKWELKTMRADNYGFLVYYSQNFNDINNVDPVITYNEQFLPNSGWEYSKTYYWKVKCFLEEKSNIIAESQVWSFTTKSSSPADPSIALNSPHNGALNVKTNTNLTWDATPSVDTGVTRDSLCYDVYYALNEKDLDTVIPVRTDEKYYIPASGWNYDTKYYWKVKVLQGERFSVSGVFSFTTEQQSNMHPQLKLLKPENNQINVNDDALLTYAATESEYNTASMFFRIYTADSPENLDKAIPKITTKKYYYPGNNWESSKKYYWKVEAVQGEYVTVRGPWVFTVKNSPVVRIELKLKLPEYGDEDVQISQELLWNATPSVSGASLNYEIYISENEENINNVAPIITFDNHYLPVGGWKAGNTYFWKVKAFDGYTSAESSVWNFKTQNRQPGYPTIELLSPEDKAENVETDKKLEWNGTPGTVGDTLIYHVYVAHSLTELDKVQPVITMESEYLPTGGWGYSSDYYWKVIVYEGEKSAASDVWEFSTEVLPPGYPEIALTYPEDGSENVRIDVTFTWNATPSQSISQNRSDILKYEFYLYESEQTIPVVTMVSEKKFKPTANLKENTDYRWKVRVIEGIKFTDSKTRSFSTGSGLDFEVSIQSPQNGERDVSLSEQLTWNATKSSLVVSEPYYLIYVAEDLAHLNYVTPIRTDDKFLNPPDGIWKEKTEYFWKIEGHNGDYMAFDGPASFTTAEKVDPVPQIEVTHPQFEEQDVDLYEELKWDLVNGTQSAGYSIRQSYVFNIYISKTESDIYHSPPSTTLTDKYEYLPINGWDESSEYFYRIQLQSNPECEDATGSFNTRGTIYDYPEIQLISPVNGATDVSLNANLTWNATESVSRNSLRNGDRLEYIVKVADTVSDLNNASLTIFATTSSMSYSPLIPWKPYSSYVWEVEVDYYVGEDVVATNSAGPYTFNTTGLPPSEFNPIPKYPAANQNDVSIFPELDWEIVNSVGTSTPTYYEIFLATNPDPTLTVSVATTTFTSYIPDELSTGTVYYWKVLGINDNGVSISPTWSFTTQVQKNSYTSAVEVSGNRLYAAQGERGLAIYDIPTDDASPLTELNVLNPGYPVFGVSKYDDILYVSLGQEGVKIINVADVYNPVELSEFDVSGFALQTVKKDDHLITADGFNGIITDVSNINSPSFVNYLDPSHEASGSVMDISMDNNFALVADGSVGLTIFDISEISTPVNHKNINFFSATNVNTLGVSYKENYIYCISASHNDDNSVTTDPNYGLNVVDFSDTDNPTPEATLNTSGFARDIFVEGDYAYIADGNNGLSIINISDPKNPAEVKSVYGGSGEYNNVKIIGNKAYVAAGSGGVVVFDISDKNNPVKIH